MSICYAVYIPATGEITMSGVAPDERVAAAMGDFVATLPEFDFHLPHKVVDGQIVPDPDAPPPSPYVPPVPLDPSYLDQRRAAYPSIEDQLDMIFDDIENWRETIRAINGKYPKPEKD